MSTIASIRDDWPWSNLVRQRPPSYASLNQFVTLPALTVATGWLLSYGKMNHLVLAYHILFLKTLKNIFFKFTSCVWKHSDCENIDKTKSPQFSSVSLPFHYLLQKNCHWQFDSDLLRSFSICLDTYMYTQEIEFCLVKFCFVLITKMGSYSSFSLAIFLSY